LIQQLLYTLTDCTVSTRRDVHLLSQASTGCHRNDGSHTAGHPVFGGTAKNHNLRAFGQAHC